MKVIEQCYQVVLCVFDNFQNEIQDVSLSFDLALLGVKGLTSHCWAADSVLRF